MENKLKLFKALQQTSRWMFALGLVMSIFNLFFWAIIVLFLSDFENDAPRLLAGVICLAISTYAGIVAVRTAIKLDRYAKTQKETYLELAFQYENIFWNCLLGMVLGGIGTFLIIIFLGA